MARDSDTIELIVDGQPQEVKIFLDKTGPAGPAGATGNGIQSITKTGSSGLVDTYTILFTDGTSTTFTVTNGQDGSADIHWGDVQGSIADQTDLQNALNGKQDKLTAGTNITIDANNVISATGGSGGGAVESVNGQTGAVVLTASDLGAYVKPTNGIPKTDLASAVRTSLDKADTALQSAPVTSVNSKTGAVVLSASDVGALPSTTSIPTKTSDLTNDSGYITSVPSEYVTESELSTAIAGKANTADLATVATSGSYADLTNKPTIPTVPTNVSAFTNDAHYITASGAPVQSVNGQTGAVTVPDTDTTYSLSISGNVITLTPSSGTASSITLPVYAGGVTA